MSRSNRPQTGTYDPGPTDAQMRLLEKLGSEGVNTEDLSHPAVTQFLIQNYRAHLTELKLAKDANESLQNDNNALRTEREELRIKVAILESRINTNWLEIPVSILSGFSINLLTNNPGDGMGWFLLIISLIILLFIRGEDLLNAVNRVRSKSKGESSG